MSFGDFGFDLPKNVKFLCLRYGIQISKHNIRDAFILLLKKLRRRLSEHY